MGHLDHSATKELDRVGFDPRLRELVRVRASQLNGCAYCIDMHQGRPGDRRDRAAPVRPGRVARDPYFTARERAALAFTEAVTLLADTHVRTRSTTRSRPSSRRTGSARC
jgi:alkylhydroperoxidase family enzyme